MSIAYQPLINRDHSPGPTSVYDIEEEDEDHDHDHEEDEDDIAVRNLTQNGVPIRGKNKRYYYSETRLESSSSSSLSAKSKGRSHRGHSWFSKEIEDSHDSNALPATTTVMSSDRGISWPSVGRRRGLIMAGSVAIVLLLLVVITAVLVENKSLPPPMSNGSLTAEGLSSNLSAITLNDYLEGRFSPHRFNGSWISDDEIQYFNEISDLVIYNVKDKSTTVILSGAVMAENLGGYRPFEAIFSPDRRFILLGHSRQQIFRHSSVAKYEIYDVETKEFIPLVQSLSRPDPQELDRFHQLVLWSTVGNGIAFVQFANVFYKANARDAEASQITFDGTINVLHGITDWVYEEEMFATSQALWFSPDGTNLAFVTFNDTEVEKIHYPIYGTSANLLMYPYPHLENLSYPKSGRTNPTARVNLVSFAENRTITNPLGQEVPAYRMIRNLQYPEVPQEHYIGSVKWASGSKVLVNTLNRHQNDSRTHLCDTQGSCDTILRTTISTGWIDVEVPHVSKNGDSFLTLTSQTQQLKNSRGPKLYRHILRFAKNSKMGLTFGAFSVDSILGWDEEGGRIYFKAPGYNEATEEAIPSETHLWFASTKSDKEPLQCVTCPLKSSVGEPCLQNAFELSTNFSHFVHTCNGGPYSPPEVTVRSTKNPSAAILTWASNSRLRNRLAKVKVPEYKDYAIDLPAEAENPFTIRARVFFPPNLVPGKKYPLLVDVYGGPGSQRISNNYAIDWSTSLVSSHSVIYASIDGRGSGRQSEDLKFQVHRRLGTVEVQDQINGGNWLINNIPSIDANRTALWGWSYGGFATAMAMGIDSIKNVYKCGISVAPVTNWLLYDTIYTERYMGLPTPDDNYEAYNKSDVTHYVDNFRNKKFYLVHGNADDNVHYQQSMILSRALERSDILFRQQSYPDESHGLSGVRPHLYHSLENFLFEECFN